MRPISWNGGILMLFIMITQITVMTASGTSNGMSTSWKQETAMHLITVNLIQNFSWASILLVTSCPVEAFLVYGRSRQNEFLNLDRQCLVSCTCLACVLDLSVPESFSIYLKIWNASWGKHCLMPLKVIEMLFFFMATELSLHSDQSCCMF